MPCRFEGSATVTWTSNLTLPGKVDGGGMNPCDAELGLNGSWQQDHSATYNAPLRFETFTKDSVRRLLRRELRDGPPWRVGTDGLSQWHGPLGRECPNVGRGERQAQAPVAIAWILT